MLSVGNPSLEGAMSTSRCKAFVGFFVGLGVLMTLLAAEVWAQGCATLVCRQGYTLTRYRERLVCHIGSGLEPQSFYYAPEPLCPPDADLRGQSCVKRVCCEKPMCPPDSRYENGRCLRGRAPGGIVILRVTCEEGWDLDRPTGMCKKRDCGAVIPLDRIPVEVPIRVPSGPFIGGFQPEGCVRKTSSVTILGREFGATQGGNRVELGGHGIGLLLPVTAWSPTSITVTIPNDPRIAIGQWYYIGLQNSAGNWITNIDKTITVCK